MSEGEVGTDTTSFSDFAAASFAGGVPAARAPEAPVCGPDITSWLLKEVANYMEQAKRLLGYFNQFGRNRPVGLKLSAVAVYSIRMNYKEIRDVRAGDRCPKGAECAATVTLDKACIHISEVGNFLFGAFAKAMEIWEWQIHLGAEFANQRDRYTAQDAAAVNLGIRYAEKFLARGGSGHAPTIKELREARGNETWFRRMQFGAPLCHTPCGDAVDVSNKKNFSTFSSKFNLDLLVKQAAADAFAIGEGRPPRDIRPSHVAKGSPWVKTPTELHVK